MILHSVAFRLKHAPESEAEAAFLRAAKNLWKLPGVLDFKVYRQIGKKNDFTFGLSMYFANQVSYDAYNAHPEHVSFVNDIWLKEVDDFMEIDYEEHVV